MQYLVISYYCDTSGCVLDSLLGPIDLMQLLLECLTWFCFPCLMVSPRRCITTDACDYVQVQLMASIKKLLDPNGILNPYKVLPQSMLP